MSSGPSRAAASYTAREKIQKSKTSLTTSNVIKFPSQEPAYFSRFSFVKYARNNPKERTDVVATSAEIVLPLPANLKEQYSINYNSSSLSYIEAGLKTYDKVINDLSDMTAMDVNMRKELEGIFQSFARSTFGNIKQAEAFDRVTGTAVNPHMVNIFQNTNLRTHNFSWELSPTSEQEARDLQRIVHTFREKMHPSLKDNTQFILGFPDEVYVTMHGSSFFYPVFKSVIQDVQIDYTDGRPNAFFIDGSPVTITLNITLQEVEALTREDFTGEAATTTGSQTAGVRS